MYIAQLEFAYTFGGICNPQIWSDVSPHYDPYVFQQVWAVIPLKGVVAIP